MRTAALDPGSGFSGSSWSARLVLLVLEPHGWCVSLHYRHQTPGGAASLSSATGGGGAGLEKTDSGPGPEPGLCLAPVCDGCFHSALNLDHLYLQ